MTNFRNRLINPIHRDFLSLCSMPLSVPPLMGTKKSLPIFSLKGSLFIHCRTQDGRKKRTKEGRNSQTNPTKLIMAHSAAFLRIKHRLQSR